MALAIVTIIITIIIALILYYFVNKPGKHLSLVLSIQQAVNIVFPIMLIYVLTR